MSSESKGNNNRRPNNHRGRGGGRGRNRVRGGRGGRGRLRESTKEKTPVDTDKKTSERTPKDDSWFIGALKNLGHFDPFSVKLAVEVEGDMKDADSQLVALTLWLEDRLIRSWTLDERGKLRTDYWNHINNYLDGLECPEDFFPEYYFSDDDKETPHWRYSASHRQRVVWFLISNATSEAYNDPSPVAKEDPIVGITEKNAQPLEPAPVPEKTEMEEAAMCEEKKENWSAQDNPFPLGFSTGDDEVNKIVMQLRMKLLIQLEEDQKAVNEAVCTVQSVTSGRAKPLKQAKLRSHNVTPPKEGRGGRERGGGRGGRGRGRGKGGKGRR